MMPRDDRTTKPNAGIHLVRPAFNAPKPMVIRILPCKNYDDQSKFDSTRFSSDAGDFSEWAVSIPAAKYIGMDQKFSFLLYDPLQEDYDARENPYFIFWNAIRSAVRAGEARLGRNNVMTSSWIAYMPQGGKQCIDKPKSQTFYQALVYQNYDDIYIKGGGRPIGAREDNMPCVVQISSHAHEQLLNLLGEEDSTYAGDPDDWRARYKYGDIVDFDGGKFVAFYNPKCQSIAELSGQSASTSILMDDSDVPDTDGDSSEVRGYAVAIVDKFHYANGGRVFAKSAVLDDQRNDWFDTIPTRIKDWDDILFFPTHDEICKYMATAYRSEPNLLKYAWRLNREFFTDEVNGILNNRVTVGMSAAAQAENDAPTGGGTKRSAALSAYGDDDADVVSDDDYVLDGDEDAPF